MKRRSTIFVLSVCILAAFNLAEAQAPKPAPPTPPPPGAADKPTGDALAQEAENKPKEPDDKDEKKPKPLTGRFAAGFNFTSGNSSTRRRRTSRAQALKPDAGRASQPRSRLPLDPK